MTWPWPHWLVLTVVTLGAVGVLWRLPQGRGRWLGMAMALVVALYPLEAWLAPRAVAWARVLGGFAWPVAYYQHLARSSVAWLVGGLAPLVWGLALAASWPYLSRRWPALRPLGRLLAALAALAALAYLGLEVAYRVVPHPLFYDDCRKVWGHRGHPEPLAIPENTIPSFENAFALGAPGVEMDVHYDPARQEFFVARYQNGEDPPPGRRLTLDQVFTAVGDRGYFWLDFQTLRLLDAATARQAARDLRALLDRFGLRQRVIVESDRPENLRYLAREGLHTSYWIFNIDEEAFPRTPWGLWWATVRIKVNYLRGGFSAISLDRRFYTPDLAWLLKGGARIHLFTVNDPDALRALVRRPEVRVILSDSAHYDITACR